jgi:helix-turn-helix protein
VSGKNSMTLAQVRKLPATCNVEVAAQALGISRASAYAAIASGDFPVAVIRVNRRMKVITHSLVAVLEGTADRAASA